MNHTNIMAIIVVLLLAGLIGGYIMELHYFYTTFEVHILFNRALFIGALFGSASGWKVVRTKNCDPIERFQWFSIFLLLGVSIIPLLAVFSNHAFANKKTEMLPVVFLKEEGRISSRTGLANGTNIETDYYIVSFLKDHAIEQIRSKIPLFPNIEQNTPVDLPFRKGFWGFDFVVIK